MALGTALSARKSPGFTNDHRGWKAAPTGKMPICLECVGRLGREGFGWAFDPAARAS
jgi:hypothetical protein